MNHDAIEFIWTNIHGWVGNLMRDLEAQGTEVSLEDVATALDRVSFEITNMPDAKGYDDFLRDVNDGRGDE